MVAVRWAAGDRKAGCGLLNRLARGLSCDQAQQLLSKHHQIASQSAAAIAARPASKSALVLTQTCTRSQSRRPHSSRPLHSRLKADQLFIDFARREGFDIRSRIPYGMMAKFLSDASVLPLSMKDRKLLRMSLRRALDLRMSGEAAVPPVGSLGRSAGQRVQRFSSGSGGKVFRDARARPL